MTLFYLKLQTFAHSEPSNVSAWRERGQWSCPNKNESKSPAFDTIMCLTGGKLWSPSVSLLEPHGDGLVNLFSHSRKTGVKSGFPIYRPAVEMKWNLVHLQTVIHSSVLLHIGSRTMACNFPAPMALSGHCLVCLIIPWHLWNMRVHSNPGSCSNPKTELPTPKRWGKLWHQIWKTSVALGVYVAIQTLKMNWLHRK